MSQSRWQVPLSDSAVVAVTYTIASRETLNGIGLDLTDWSAGTFKWDDESTTGAQTTTSLIFTCASGFSGDVKIRAALTVRVGSGYKSVDSAWSDDFTCS